MPYHALPFPTMPYHVLSSRQVPSKLCVGWQPRSEAPWKPAGTPLTAAERGGPQQSKTVPLPPAVFAGVHADSELRRGVPYAQSGRTDLDVISPETLVTEEASQHAALTSGVSCLAH